MAGKLTLPGSALIRPGRKDEDDTNMEQHDEPQEENRQDAKGSVDAASAEPAAPALGEKLSREKLEEMVIDAMRTVYDPEIPVNIYDLGLVYDMRVDDAGKVSIKMTLTTPMCPVAGSMPGMVEKAVRHVHAVTDCEVELVWDPAWNPDMMTEAARLQLNI